MQQFYMCVCVRVCVCMYLCVDRENVFIYSCCLHEVWEVRVKLKVRCRGYVQ